MSGMSFLKSKKTAVFALLLLLTTLASAQVLLSESFTGTTFPPAGWTRYNFNGGKQWQRDAGNFNSAPGSAKCLTDAANNDWLISPRIGPIDPTDSLSFFYNAGQANREETLLVRVSTNLSFAETAAYTRIFTVAARKTAAWQRRSLSLSAFAGQQVYVAFHYVSRNKRSILIDDINVLRYTNPFFLITATAQGAGTITPNGVVVVTPYTDTTFYLQAQTGYPLDSLIVDGVNHGKDSIRYKFSNVSTYHTITAYFKVKYWTLTTVVNGSGSITKTPNLTNYPDGSEVELTATPANGWTFVNWSGDIAGNVNPYLLDMDTNKTVIANFRRDTFTVYASKEGNGTIVPAGLSYLPRGGSISYTMTPNAGHYIYNVFVNGAPVGAVTSYTFNNIQANQTIHVEFQPLRYTLTVNTAGTGNGTVNKQPDMFNYAYGSYVKLTAIADSMSDFSFWSGDLSGSNNPDSILINSNKTVTANFSKRTYNLSVNINPLGAGNVAINPASGPYAHGIWVKLQASANTGWSFANYSGDLTSSNAYDSVYMNSNKTVTANFAINYYTLTLNTVGNGIATKTPDTSAYYYGQVVRLDAYPATGWSFRNWSGSFSSTANPEYILMNGDKNITASFSLDTFTITASSGLHGSVTPTGVTYLGYGGSQTYRIRPDTGFHTLQILVDGLPVPIDTVYSFVNVTANHTISASFGIDTFTITASAGPNGSVTPTGITYAPYGSDQIYTISPNTGYHTLEILVDGSPVPISQTYEFGFVQANHTIHATFGIDSFTITASAGPNGSVTPSGTSIVTYGGIKVYNITPDVGYHITGVYVNGSPVTIAPTYTFINVVANHTISASFGIDSFTITASAGANGLISPSGATIVTYGSSQTYNITPAAGYYISQILVDGNPVAIAPTYTFTNVAANHTISASFNVESLTIYASASAHGAIAPSGAVKVSYNGAKNFSIIPNAGAHIVDVIVDGVSQGTINSYTFNNVTQNHTIHAVFALDLLSITASTNGNGTISPSGTVYLSYGANQSFTITPAANHHVQDVLVDGISQGRITSYNFINVTTSRTIEAFFQIDSNTITASAGANGSINPSGSVLVPYNGSQTFSITPNIGYHTIQILVDGNPVTIAPNYTFNNVITSHTISASFGIDSFTITASAGANGTVTPSGTTIVTYGSSQIYNITPVTGASIREILVDGSPVTNSPTYTFTNVTANHTIWAGFSVDSFTITSSAGPHGTITPNGITYLPYGATQSYIIKANQGDHIREILVDGFPVTIDTIYTFTNVTASHTIHAWFAADTFAITASAGPNGSISPAGVSYVPNSGSLLYTITPNLGYHTIEIRVDGNPVAVAPTYEFINVRANHTIHATFGIDSFTITASAGAHGTVTPAGISYVTYGSSKTYNITPVTGFHTIRILVDGVPEPITSSYTFTNITANHTISATFGIDSFVITATAGPNGVILPSGTTTVTYGSNQIYNIIPDPNYHTVQVIIDGSPSVSDPTTYVFTNVTANHTIHATFGIDSFTITASAGANGIITPSGAVIVTYGANRRFYIIPSVGYHTLDVLIDGSSYGPISYYEFVNVMQNHTIHAEFTINTYTLNVNIAGNGSVAPDPLSGSYEHGTWVKLTAIPDLNWAFVRWTGDLSGRANPDSVFMDGNKNITAHFADATLPYTLTINIDGLGTVIKTPNLPTYAFGDWVVLSANSNEDWSFDGWYSEYFTSTNNPDSIQITGNTSITALFVFTGVSGWLEREPVPTASDLKPNKFVKDGGALVAVGNDLYAFHGNKSWKFYKYSSGSWDTTIANIPFGCKYDPRKGPDTMLFNTKKVGRGAALVYDYDHDVIYAVKGSGTYEFWAYDVSENTWMARAFLPTMRKIKGGTSLTYHNGLVYLLATGQKGSENNFFAYNPANNSWTALHNPPNGPYGKLWSLGTGLSSNGNYIYALKGKDKYNPLWSYNIMQDTWIEKEPMPIINRQGKSSKIRDGGALTTDGSVFYAIKGGGKQDFWMYTPAQDSTPGIWTELDIIPLKPGRTRKSTPKTGAGLAYANNKVWLMKGNNYNEFWRYTNEGNAQVKPVSPQTYTTISANNLTDHLNLSLIINPNPVVNMATINYVVPSYGKVTIKLYNSSGRLVETLLDNMTNAGNYTTTLNATTLAKGIYFLKYEANNEKSEVKLIVQ